MPALASMPDPTLEEPLDPKFTIHKGRELVGKWFEGLNGFDPGSDAHVKECHELYNAFNVKAKHEIDLIMNSVEIRDIRGWKQFLSPGITRIFSESDTSDSHDTITYCAAFLAGSEPDGIHNPSLSFFCGIRARESLDQNYAGPIAVLNSLNGQLLEFITDGDERRGPPMDLSFLREPKYMEGSQINLDYGLELFEKLLKELPAGRKVFAVLDSLSRIVGDRDWLIEELHEVIEDVHKVSNVVVKVLVTNPLRDCLSRDLARSSLVVPARVENNLNERDDSDGCDGDDEDDEDYHIDTAGFRDVVYRDYDSEDGTDSSDGEYWHPVRNEYDYYDG